VSFGSSSKAIAGDRCAIGGEQLFFPDYRESGLSEL
jgi:hypothetical protein